MRWMDTVKVLGFNTWCNSWFVWSGRRCHLRFKTHEIWNAQTDEIGGSDTFYFKSSTCIKYIMYKRVNHVYPTSFRSLRPFFGLRSRNRPVKKTLATKLDCWVMKTFFDTNKELVIYEILLIYSRVLEQVEKCRLFKIESAQTTCFISLGVPNITRFESHMTPFLMWM